MDILHDPASLTETQGKPSARAAGAPVSWGDFFRRWVTAVIVRRPKLALLAAAVAVILVETCLVLVLRSAWEGVNPWVAGLFHALPVVLLGWGLFVLLRGIAGEQARSGRQAGLLSDLSQRLGPARSLDDVAQQIVEFIHQVSGQAGVTLAVVNPNTLMMDVQAVCSSGGSVTIKPQRSAWPGEGAEGTCIELPITRNDFQIGLIRLDYPLLGSRPAENSLLTDALPVMALALESALLQAMAADQAAESETQRQKIAQNLHDSLAQNISYLRMKLDQLTGENAAREIGDVLAELESMRASADEAYQQVRSTLDELNPIQGKDLVTLISRQAEAIAERANLRLTVGLVGQPRDLPAGMSQHILFIAREALHNVEKHAQACRVDVQFVWLEHELIFKVSDDGVGIAAPVQPLDGHYGLWIMQNRANEMNGVLKVLPAETQGTEVTLWVPAP